MDIILSVKGISKTYTAGQVKINALNRCDIEVRKGEFTAIVGKSGSGKSTLLRILGTMDKPDEGKVYIAGKDISNLKNSELAKFRRTHIGFIYRYLRGPSGIHPLSAGHGVLRPARAADGIRALHVLQPPRGDRAGQTGARGARARHGGRLRPPRSRS